MTKWTGVRRLSAEIEQSGQTASQDLNNLAWITLFDGTAATEGSRIV
ncbi:MAG: hypothetical protein K2X03_15735 [Bryobacteraceae bacterium]|nr:hypothetical protein [Bryobacteraceae bacterium]